MSIEIQVELSGGIKDYGMYSELGNAAVHGIIIAALENKMTWPQTYRALYQLSDQKGFGEATDTEVREIVYSTLNFNTPFYF